MTNGLIHYFTFVFIRVCHVANVWVDGYIRVFIKAFSSLYKSLMIRCLRTDRVNLFG